MRNNIFIMNCIGPYRNQVSIEWAGDLIKYIRILVYVIHR